VLSNEPIKGGYSKAGKQMASELAGTIEGINYIYLPGRDNGGLTTRGKYWEEYWVGMLTSVVCIEGIN
jgi:hypothetical protein